MLPVRVPILFFQKILDFAIMTALIYLADGLAELKGIALCLDLR
jgi:hypothetical protein